MMNFTRGYLTVSDPLAKVGDIVYIIDGKNFDKVRALSVIKNSSLHPDFVILEDNSIHNKNGWIQYRTEPPPHGQGLAHSPSLPTPISIAWFKTKEEATSVAIAYHRKYVEEGLFAIDKLSGVMWPAPN